MESLRKVLKPHEGKWLDRDGELASYVITRTPPSRVMDTGGGFAAMADRVDLIFSAVDKHGDQAFMLTRNMSLDDGWNYAVSRGASYGWDLWGSLPAEHRD